MKLPFFLSAPRTRISVLFETAQPYLQEVHNVKVINGHSEYFLMRAQWADFWEGMKTLKKYDKVRNTNLLEHFSEFTDYYEQLSDPWIKK